MGRCCLRANALARFHAICCKLKHRISLARDDIRVHAHQDVRSRFEMEVVEAPCDVAGDGGAIQSRYSRSKSNKVERIRQQKRNEY